MSAPKHLGQWSEINTAINDHRSQRPEPDSAEYAAWKKKLGELEQKLREWSDAWRRDGKGVATLIDLAGWIRDKIDLYQSSTETHQYSGLASQSETDSVKWAIILAGKLNVLDRPSVPTDILNKPQCIALFDQLLRALQKSWADRTRPKTQFLPQSEKYGAMSQSWRELDKQRRELQAKWAERIEQTPSRDPAILRQVVISMRSFSRERDEKKISLQKYQEMAMNLVCDAICAGAFMGAEWLKFRTRLKSDPSFENAVKFLEADTPSSSPTIVAKLEKPDDGTFQISSYIDRFADEFEARAGQKHLVQSESPLNPSVNQTRKSGLRRGRPNPRDERSRNEILAKWDRAKAAKISQKVFCEDNDIGLKDLEKWINWRTTRNRRKN